MSELIIPVSLDRIVRSWNQKSEDPEFFNIFIIYRINQDQDLSKPLKEEPSCVCSLRTDRPDFSSQIFKSDNKVMKFLLISYWKSDVIGRLD